MCFAIASLLIGSTAVAQTRIKFALEATEGSLNYDMTTFFKVDLEKRLLGRVQVEILSGGQLGPDRATLNGLRLGTHEISLIASPVASVEPSIGVFEAPFLFVDRESVKRVINGPVGEELLRRISAKGMYALSIGELGFRVITNNVRPIVTPDDLRGIKIRIPNTPFRSEIFRQYGANPSAIPFSEVFIALKQGVIDGQENPIPSIHGAKFYEVQKYLSLSNHLYTPNVFLASKVVFDRWPPEVQAAVRAAARAAAEFSFARGAELDTKFLEEIRKYSAVNTVDQKAFRDASLPLYKQIGEKSDKSLLDQMLQMQR
jgi:tripartite ATP-independent transporter DctP family solute receptor